MANEGTKEQMTACAIESLKMVLRNLETGAAHAEWFTISAENVVDGAGDGFVSKKATGRRVLTVITQQVKEQEGVG